MAKNALKFFARRAANELRVSLLLKQLKRIGYQGDLVRPMTIDRGLADAGPPRDTFDGKRAITRLTEFVENRLQNHLSGALDSWINSGLRSTQSFWGLSPDAQRVACCSVVVPFRTRARGAIGRCIGLKQLHEISGWVFQQDLFATSALNDFVAKTRAGGLELRDAPIEIVDEEVDTVPTARRLLLARGHRRTTANTATLGLRQIKMHVTARDLGEARRRVHLEFEAEMPSVEVDRRFHVVHDVAETRGHGSVLSLCRLSRIERI